MIDNKTKQKSNKHSGESDIKEFIERPIHSFNLLEPDEILKGTAEGYKRVATKWLTNFNGALFQRFTDRAEGSIKDKTYVFLTDELRARTDLSKDELLQQLNAKLGVNITCLNSVLTGITLPYPNIYKNLDDFKGLHTFKIDNISVIFEDWIEVELVRLKADLHHPVHHIIYNLDKFGFNDYVLRNIVNYHIPYSNYLSSITYPYNKIVAERPINKASCNIYTDEVNKFKLTKLFTKLEGFIDVSGKDITVSFSFDIDLYFSHIKYLYKVFQTYN